VSWRHACPARRTKKPGPQRGRQYLDREIRQLTPPVIEQRPIGLIPCAGFYLPVLRMPLTISVLLAGLAARKVRKVRKGGGVTF